MAVLEVKKGKDSRRPKPINSFTIKVKETTSLRVEDESMVNSKSYSRLESTRSRYTEYLEPHSPLLRKKGPLGLTIEADGQSRQIEYLEVQSPLQKKGIPTGLTVESGIKSLRMSKKSSSS